MKAKSANIIASIFLIGFGIWILTQANQFIDNKVSQIDASYFPTLLSYVLIILSLISIVKTLFSKDTEIIKIPNFRRILWSIALVGLFFLSWRQFEFFYIQTFIFLFILTTLYRLPLGLKKKVIAVNLAVTVSLTILIYFIFDMLLYTRF